MRTSRDRSGFLSNLHGFFVAFCALFAAARAPGRRALILNAVLFAILAAAFVAWPPADEVGTTPIFYCPCCELRALKAIFSGASRPTRPERWFSVATDAVTSTQKHAS